MDVPWGCHGGDDCCFRAEGAAGENEMSRGMYPGPGSTYSEDTELKINSEVMKRPQKAPEEAAEEAAGREGGCGRGGLCPGLGP